MENAKKRRPMEFQMEDELEIHFSKKAGEEPFLHQLAGKPPIAVLGGIEALILEFAVRTKMSVVDVLGMITSDMLTPTVAGGEILQ